MILVCGMCSSIMGPRVIELNYFLSETATLSGGIIPFCVSFMLLDIVTNQYGSRRTKTLIYYYLICKALMSLILYFTMQLHTAQEFHDESSYTTVIDMVLRSFIASSFGTLVSFFLNCYIFSKLYISFAGKHLWLRCLVATTLGEIVFSLVSTPILFHNKLSLDSIIHLIFHNYMFKILFEIITLPIIYLVIYILSKVEVKCNIQYLDFTPSHKQINPDL